MKRALMMVVALAALDPQRSSKPCTNCGRLTVRRARRNESYPIARSRGSTLAERYSGSFTRWKVEQRQLRSHVAPQEACSAFPAPSRVT